MMDAGNLLIGQTGGPTAVINASLAGLIAEAHSQPQIKQIYGMRQGIEGLLKHQWTDLTQLPAETLNMLAQTPAAALGSSRYKAAEADYERMLAVCRVEDVRYMALIGGNGTMALCQHIADFAAAQGDDLRVIGVPKTIDNDLTMTDHTPGYGSAARFLAWATRDTGLDLESMVTFDDVLILEALGRHTGWLAAASALAKGDRDEAPHLVYVPEFTFDEAQFLDDVRRIHSRLGRIFIVIGEGIRDHNGTFIGGYNAPVDALGRVLYSAAPGAAAYLADRVREALHLQVRFIRPSLIGRDFSACVSDVDRREAWQVGQAAVDALAQGETGCMITLERISDQPYQIETGRVPLSAVAGSEKLLPPEFFDPSESMITSAFLQYASPLMGEPLPPMVRL